MCRNSSAGNPYFVKMAKIFLFRTGASFFCSMVRVMKVSSGIRSWTFHDFRSSSTVRKDDCEGADFGGSR